MYDTDVYELKMAGAVDHLEDELKKVRTGRAHPGMLDSIKVEMYGTEMPLNQVANVTAPEAQLLQITPFDPTSLQKIAAAIRSIRQDGLKEAKRMKDEKKMSEDDLKVIEKEFEHLMSEYQGKIEHFLKVKEEDILKI